MRYPNENAQQLCVIARLCKKKGLRPKKKKPANVYIPKSRLNGNEKVNRHDETC